MVLFGFGFGFWFSWEMCLSLLFLENSYSYVKAQVSRDVLVMFPDFAKQIVGSLICALLEHISVYSFICALFFLKQTLPTGDWGHSEV